MALPAGPSLSFEGPCRSPVFSDLLVHRGALEDLAAIVSPIKKPDPCPKEALSDIAPFLLFSSYAVWYPPATGRLARSMSGWRLIKIGAPEEL